MEMIKMLEVHTVFANNPGLLGALRLNRICKITNYTTAK
jgi:hypothetical protein